MNQMRSTRRAAVLAVTFLGALTSCREFSTASDHDVVVRTGQAVYQVAPGATSLTVDATLTNDGDEALLLDGLGRDFQRLEKRVGGSWQLAYSPIYVLPLVPDIALPPGQSLPLSLNLHVGQAPNTFPRFEYDIPGIYRAVFGFSVSDEAGFEVYSNEFEIRGSQ